MISLLGNYSYTFPDKQALHLRLKDMLEQNVDEKYFLSDKMIDYISATNQKWTGNNNGAFINKDIASTLTTGEGSKRCDASNYVSDDLPNNYDLQNKQILIREATKKGYTEAQDDDGVYINRPHQKRGVVQKGMIQTIKTSPDIGVVVNAEIKPVLVGSSYKYLVKDKLGNEILLHKDAKQLRETIKNCELEQGKALNLDLYNRASYEESQTITEPHHNSQRLFDGLRIRKLTPKECYRLMGFSDSDFDKASKFNSNAQLYKQAGNSIVVNVLEAIFKQLL